MTESTASSPFTVEQCRRFYAEEIRFVTGGCSEQLVHAFARVPREQFLGAPPWRVPDGVMLQPSRYRSLDDVRDLYHDVVVALKEEQQLNSAQPSQMARMITALHLAEGMRVLHVGSGSGYYSALMAEVVGPRGQVLAIEIDPELAERAAVSLAGYSNVQVVNGDGADCGYGSVDAVLVNAGITHPHPDWLAGLSAAGVLVAPFLVGPEEGMREALVLRLARVAERFAAEPVTSLAIYPSTSQRDPAVQAKFRAAIASRSILVLKSARTDPHPETAACLVHTPGFCLSAEAVL